MTLFSDFRDRLASRSDHTTFPNGDGAAPDEPTGAPFSGYDRMDSRKLMAQLNGFSQDELTAIESYEREHQNRIEVLHKLRYMRGAEPLEGYDALSPDQIAAALADADLPTIKKVRDYERKFANRKEVVDLVAELHTKRLGERAPQDVPAYQAGGGSHDNL